MSVTRTISLADLTSGELADLFCELGSSEQADFLATIIKIASSWGGAGWCQQSSFIMRDANQDAREAVRVLASHLPPEDLAWVAMAGAA